MILCLETQHYTTLVGDNRLQLPYQVRGRSGPLQKFSTEVFVLRQSEFKSIIFLGHVCKVRAFWLRIRHICRTRMQSAAAMHPYECRICCISCTREKNAAAMQHQHAFWIRRITCTRSQSAAAMFPHEFRIRRSSGNMCKVQPRELPTFIIFCQHATYISNSLRFLTTCAKCSRHAAA